MSGPKHLPPAFTSEPTSTNRTRPEYRAAVTCRRCGRKDVGTDKVSCPPEVIAKHFQRDGWDIHRGGASATCPACQGKPEAEEDMTRDAIRAQIKAGDLIREHSESESGQTRYHKEWDDDRIARETGLSVEAVREVREVVRPGRLVDPALEELAQAVQAERERSVRAVDELRQLLAAEQEAHGKNLAALDRRLQDLRRRPAR